MVKEISKSEVIKLRISKSTKKQIKNFAKQEGRFFEKQCQMILDQGVKDKPGSMGFN